ncbi:MAG: hypothetical protein ACYSTF_01725, partial [Planctomycetota bacterium]
PIVKKYGWRFMLLTLLFCLLPYYDTDVAIMALVPFLFASSANITKVWAARSMGEDEYSRMLLELAMKSKFSMALFGIIMSSIFVILAGLVLSVLCSYPEKNSGYWFGIGIILYGFIVALHGYHYFRALFRKAKQVNNANVDGKDLLQQRKS